MNKNYMKVIEALGEVIAAKEIDIDLLKYENEKLKEKMKSIEEHCDYYVNSVSNTKI